MLSHRLRDASRNVIIIAHREDTTKLEQAFNEEGLSTRVLRRSYKEKEKAYSQSIRVLLSHIEAWKISSQSNTSTIICEADFVPCKGFSNFSIPSPPESTHTKYISWLYACGPTIYDLNKQDSLIYARGHCAAPVAVLVSQEVAQKLLRFGNQELKASNPHSYSTWDTRITVFLKQENVESYISFRNYGEHGGIPNSEHRFHGKLPAAHRADSLMAPLHFLPLYAKGSKVNYILVRLKAKIYGIIRILCFRMIRAETIKSKSTSASLDLLSYVFQRICCWN